MPENVKRFDMRGGLSRLRRQNPNQVYLCQNMRPIADGTLLVRNGQSKIVDISSTGNIEAVHVRYTSNLGLRVYSIRRTGTVNDTIYENAAPITGPAFDSGDYSTIVEYKGVLFFTNGKKAIQYHQPVADPSKVWGVSIWGADNWGTVPVRAAVTGSPTLGQFLLIYKDRMYIGTEDGLVFWSNVGLFSALPAVNIHADSNQIIGDQYNPVTGLAKGEDFIVAFTKGSYNIMTGTPGDDADISTMDWQSYSNIGCTASRSIAYQGRRIAFLGTDRRMYILDGALPTNIDPLNQVEKYLLGFHDSVIRAVASVFYRNELWIYVPKGGTESIGNTLVYNYELKNWTVFSGITSFAFHFSPTLGKLYAGRADESRVYNPDSGKKEPDNSLPAVDFIGRQEPFGSFRKFKTFREAVVQADVNQGESLTVSYALNNNSKYTTFGDGSPIAPTGNKWGAQVWGVSAWGGIAMRSNVLQPVDSGSGIRGLEMRLQITGNVSPGTRLLGYELDADIEERTENL